MKLLIGRHDDEDDLPRNAQDTALIGDPRNDENIFVSQWQLTMLKFHNKVVDLVDARPVARSAAARTRFEAAQRIVRWHYQWIVVHDFLRRIVGAGDARRGARRDGRGPEVDRALLQLAQRPVHAGRVLGRRLPVRALA